MKQRLSIADNNIKQL